VRRFLLGMLAGVVLGGGVMLLALKRPWEGGSSASAPAADAGVAAAANGAGKGKGRGKGTKKRAAPVEEGPVVLTDADRAMVWKGDAVELPPREVDMESGAEARSLSGGEINQVIRGSSQAVSDCLTSAAGNAEIKAQITLKLLVDGNGRVKKVRTRAPAYLFAHGLNACIRGAAFDLSFPATGGHTVVTAPYDLY
jgi:hypothetical protein